MEIKVNEKCVRITKNDIAADRLFDTACQIEANPDKFYLLDPSIDMKLWEVINNFNELNEQSDLNNENTMIDLTGIKFAYEIMFTEKTFLSKNPKDTSMQDAIPVKNLSEILECFEVKEDGLLVKDYQIIIDDSLAAAAGEEDEPSKQDDFQDALATLFQQFIFLGLKVDIKRSSEIKLDQIKRKFRSCYEDLLDKLVAQQTQLTKVSEEQLSEGGKARKRWIAENLDAIPTLMKKAQSRPIRIAAMGTKKAGKSVVINSLIGEEYAPTDLVLPTPNAITYVPVQSDEITLIYDGKTMPFDTAMAVRKYIKEEFIKAQQFTGDGSQLGDMVVQYPAKGLGNYEIMDTPGPNFAGAGKEHEKIAEACIRRADVCIFVMNYANHLSNDEVNFLKKIRDYFAAENKFYSLLIIVNWIDKRYESGGEKSVNRVVDYIKDRLEKLDYKNIATFGTSALQYFYLQKARLIAKQDKYEMLNVDIVRKLKKTHKAEMTVLSFVKNSLDQLADFHNINSPNDKTLEVSSGMPYLIDYTRYIGEQKVDSEIVSHVMHEIDIRYSNIKNALLITQLSELRNASETEYEKLLELFNAVNKTIADEKKKIDMAANNGLTQDGMIYRTQKSLDSARNQWKKEANDNIEFYINKKKFAPGDIRGIHQEDQKMIEKLVFDINQATVVTGEKITDISLGDIKKAWHKEFFISQEEIMQESEAIINKKVEEVRIELNKGDDAYKRLAEFAVPELPASFSKLDLGGILLSELDPSEINAIAKMSYYEYEQRYKKSDRREGAFESFFGWIGDCFTGDYETETRSSYKVEKFKEELIASITAKTNKAIEAKIADTKEKCDKDMRLIFASIEKQLQVFIEQYQTLFMKLKEDIELAAGHAKEKQEAFDRDIAFFNEINENMRSLLALWEDIRK